MNKASSANGPFDSDLERDLAVELSYLLGSYTGLGGWAVSQSREHRSDLVAKGPLSEGSTGEFWVDCKSAVFQPSQFAMLVAQRPAPPSPNAARALGMPRVTERMAELCRRHGWGWFDLGGNCHLKLPGLLIDRSGRPTPKPERRSGANLGTPEAGLVLRALLAPENAGRRWTQRSMAAHFEDIDTLSPVAVPAPSLALVNKVVQHLRDLALVESLPERGFRVVDYEALLRAWRDAYRFDRHPRRAWFTLAKPLQIQERLWHWSNRSPQPMLAAFSAADIQAPNVRQAKLWIYADPSAEEDLADALDAKPVDSGDNVVVLVAQDRGVFYKPQLGTGHAPCTNPVQTYVDLNKAGGRGEEAAEAILEQRLRPVWRAAS